MSSSDLDIVGRRFVTTASVAAAIIAGVLLAATALADPTGLLVASGWPRGLCAAGLKVRDDRAWKPYMAAIHLPEQAILGSSRVSRGFDSRAFGPAGGKALNLGMSSATMSDIDALARKTIEEAPVRRIWIGLDFGAVADAGATVADFGQPDLAGTPRLRSLRTGLLSPGALEATLTLVRHPSSCATPQFDAQAFVNPEADDTGNRHVVIPDERARARQLASWRRTASKRRRSYAANIAELERLLVHLAEHDVTVILYRSPSHPAFDTLLAEAGLTPLQQRWRSDTDQMASRHGVILVAADAPDFLLGVDASGCTGLRADCVFHDATHFRPEVGAAIVRAGEAALTLRAQGQLPSSTADPSIVR